MTDETERPADDTSDEPTPDAEEGSDATPTDSDDETEPDVEDDAGA